MSDSTNSSFSFLSNWKFSLAVCVPCFAVGLGATYYFYSKSNNKNRRPREPTAKHGIEGNNVDRKPLVSNGIDSNTVKVHKPVSLFTYYLHFCYKYTTQNIVQPIMFVIIINTNLIFDRLYPCRLFLNKLKNLKNREMQSSQNKIMMQPLHFTHKPCQCVH